MIIFDKPRTVEATTTLQHLTLNGQKYQLIHTGMDSAGAEDPTPIYFGFDNLQLEASPEQNNSFILTIGPTIYIGPDVEILSYITATSTPLFQLVPLGAQIFDR